MNQRFLPVVMAATISILCSNTLFITSYQFETETKTTKRT
jgi:hypothetical protein